MILIDFEKIILNYNKLIKKYDNVEYTNVLEEYKKYLKFRYKNKNNKNYNKTTNGIFSMLQVYNLHTPVIKNSPISYGLRNIKIKNIKVIIMVVVLGMI